MKRFSTNSVDSNRFIVSDQMLINNLPQLEDDHEGDINIVSEFFVGRVQSSTLELRVKVAIIEYEVIHHVGQESDIYLPRIIGL